MLVPAYTRSDELNSKFIETMLDPYYKYYHGSYTKAAIKIDDTFWNKVQLVSLDKKNNICGYFKATWSRPENYIRSVSIINFNRKNPRLFASDISKFFKYLILELKPKKINFHITIGNPAENHYDRLVNNLGGRVVGIKKYDCLINDSYYDSKQYEIINDYWECDNCGYTSKRLNGLQCKKCKGKMVYKNPFE